MDNLVHLAEIYKEVHELLSRIFNRFAVKLQKPVETGFLQVPMAPGEKNTKSYKNRLSEKCERGLCFCFISSNFQRARYYSPLRNQAGLPRVSDIR